MYYVILSFLIILVSGFAYIFPRYYISELVLSFTPYSIVLLFLGLLVSIVLVRKYSQAKRRQLTFPWWWGFAGLFTLCFGVLFWLYSGSFTRFYTNTLPSASSNETNLQVLFANIHKNSTDYTGIQNLIIQHDPDLLMFVEFAPQHSQHLKTFLQTHYPYTNSTTRSKAFIGSTVFSKQKIENRADDFQQGMWRYGYFSLSFGGEEYYFYLVHTSSPDSHAHFLMRNQQLASFDSDFALHETVRSHDKVIVAGDFNITPWSVYYRDMQEVFSGKLVNITQQFPLLFTWKLFAFPLFRAHIDHLWASTGVQITRLESILIPGSDHRGFLFEIEK